MKREFALAERRASSTMTIVSWTIITILDTKWHTVIVVLLDWGRKHVFYDLDMLSGSSFQLRLSYENLGRGYFNHISREFFHHQPLSCFDLNQDARRIQILDVKLNFLLIWILKKRSNRDAKTAHKISETRSFRSAAWLRRSLPSLTSGCSSRSSTRFDRTTTWLTGTGWLQIYYL